MKTITLLFGVLFSVLCHAQSKNQIIKKVIANNKQYKSHHAVYRSWMKFQSDDDTGFDVQESEIINIRKQAQMGITRIFYPKDTVYYTYDLNEMVKLYSSNDNYYSMNKSKYGSEFMIENFKNFQYRPFRFTYKDLKKYTLAPDTNTQYYILEFKETNIGKMDTIVFHTLLYVRKSDYMPSRYFNWAYFGGGVQYKRIELDKVEELNSPVPTFRKRLDSLSRAYKTHISGDSMGKIFIEKFRKIKVGDTCKALIGAIHSFEDSVNLFQNGDSILIIDFSYTSCGWCIYSIPALNNLYRKYDSTGVGLYSVDPYKNDWPKLDKFIGFYKVLYPIVKVDYQYTFDYGVRAYPTLYIIKNGVLIYMHVGYSEKMEDEINKVIDQALGK